MRTEMITKEKLIEWAKGLQATDVEVTIEPPIGGGESTPGRAVFGYCLTIAVAEEFPNDEKPGFDKLMS